MGTGSWVEGMPECAYTKEINGREWVIEASNIEWNIAGNDTSDVEGAVASALSQFLS